MIKNRQRAHRLRTLFSALWAPTLAQASVSVYGIADVGIGFEKSGGPGGAKVTRLASGYGSGSRLGFMGSEDLGGGLRSVFTLESGFDLDTGTPKAYAGNPASATPALPGGAMTPSGFNRRSHIGLSGAFGTLLAGRDYTPLFWTGAATDPMNFSLYGNLQAIGARSGTGIERFGRVSNGVFYTSPTRNGFTARLVYSLGSESSGVDPAPPKGANELVAVGLQYNSGPWLLAGAHQRLKLPVVRAGAFDGLATRKDLIVGAGYTTGSLSFSGGYFKVSHPTPQADGRDIWIGGSWTSGPGKVSLLVQRLCHASCSAGQTATSSGIGYVYALSRRSALYATTGKVKNGAKASFPLAAGDPVVSAGGPGAAPQGIAFGIRSAF